MDIDYSKFQDEFLKLAFEEASKRLTESFNSFRQIVDKSFIASGIYFSILVYAFDHLTNVVPNTVLLIVSVICIWKIWPNLMPGQLYFPGADPKDTLHEFYFDKSNQVREFHISRIEVMEKSIESNDGEITKRHKRFRCSALIMVIGFVLTFLCSFSFVTKCFFRFF